MRLTVILSTLLGAATSVTASCNADNCLNQIRKAASAPAFCATYTTTVNTNPSAIPTYLNNCLSSSSRVSSACSCLMTATSSASTKTSSSIPLSSSTSSSARSTTTSSSRSSTYLSTSTYISTSTVVITVSSVSKSSTSSASASATASAAPYWLESIKHQGVSAFNSNSSYQVFRNVKDFGAKGDGVTDDTKAINAAMSAGGRTATASTTTPAVVYFPCGTYLISSSIVDYYLTQIIGNPNCLPTLKATPKFSGFGLIDGDVYGNWGVLPVKPTNMFYRQIRNLVFDTRSIAPGSSATGVHWPTAQATSLQNCVFMLSDAHGTDHVGLFIEDGSGGFMNDLVFYGGYQAAWFGNQQFTARNLTFNNAVTAIYQDWDWGWTYQSISFNNCTVGLNMSTGGRTDQSVGSVIMTDSMFTNVGVAVITAHDNSSLPTTAGSLILENIYFKNTPIGVQGPSGTVLDTESGYVSGWGQGHSYTPSGPTSFEDTISFARPEVLTASSKWYARSKPQYETQDVGKFVSVRNAGAKGDGVTDDTAALQNVISAAAAADKIVFFDAGTYKVNSTITIPGNSKIVGESYSTIMGAGSFFSDATNPQPVVQVGAVDEVGLVEWSDMIVSTQGGTAGAILIQWNLASADLNTPAGMWDVHTRIGGFAGSKLQLGQCPTTATPSSQCQAAFMSLYIAPSASAVYMENNWFWTADHDIENANSTQISVYSGRGLYCASTSGTVWMYASSVEHHDLYQYQFANTSNIYGGQIQTESPYWQPSPAAGVVTPTVAGWNDPDFSASCAGVSGNCAMSWGLRVLSSNNLFFYGAGLYSFFDAYNLTCSNPIPGMPGNGAQCQSRIFSIEGSSSKYVFAYNLNTVGSTQMVTKDGASLASYADNMNVYPDTIAMFRST